MTFLPRFLIAFLMGAYLGLVLCAWPIAVVFYRVAIPGIDSIGAANAALWHEWKTMWNAPV